MKPSCVPRVAGVGLLAAILAQPASADERAARLPAPDCGVLGGRGELRTEPVGAWQALARGARLPARAEVRAGGEGMRICVAKGTAVDLAPGASVDLLGEARVTVGATKIQAIELRLRDGELSLEPSAGRWSGPLRTPVLVRGPGDVQALDAGGGVRARVLAARGALLPALAIAAYRDDAQVSTQRLMRPLRAGHAAELRAGEAPTAAHALLSAPAWVSDVGATVPGPLSLVASADATATVAARFGAVPGAAGYDVDIARDAAFADVAARVSLGAVETALLSPPLRSGRYFARVGARGVDGLRGFSSAARELRVARIELPPSGALVGGIVVVPPGQPFAWDDPSGLELSVGTAPFTAASRTLGLGDGETERGLLFRVRMAGESTFVPMALTPLMINAEIELGPKTATWPSDPVWITARVVTPGGGDSPYEPSLRVTVNREEITPSWQRTGNVYRTTVGPRPGAGPWVVRAEARDKHGRELGFGFLEVIRRRVP